MDRMAGGMKKVWDSLSKSFQKQDEMEEVLCRLARDLEKAVSDVEPFFIALGRELQDVHQKAFDLTRRVLNWIGLMDANRPDSAFSSLRKFSSEALEDLASCQREIQEKTSQRKLVMEYIQGLAGIFASVEKIGLLLKIVATNIGIESARTLKSSDLFSVVSMETGKLSVKIRQISETSFNVLQAAGESQNALYENLVSGLDQVRQLGRQATKIVHEAVCDIENLMVASRHEAEKAEKNARSIGDQIEELVMAMQFHDNMSQRMAHIVKALKDAGDLLRTSQLDRHRDRKERNNAIQTTLSIIHLQSRQLSGIISEILRVHHQGQEAFKRIAGDIDGLLSGLTRISAGTVITRSQDGTLRDPFENLRSSLENLVQVLNQGMELLNPARQSASKASETVEQIETLVHHIHTIEFETHLMALNAIVKASHLGQDGGALEVLAQEVKQSSDQSIFVLSRTGDLLDKITTAAGKLQEECAINASSGALNQAVGQLSQLCRDFSSDSENAKSQAQDIQKTVSRLLTGMDFMPKLAGSLTLSMKTLENITPSASPDPENGSTPFQDPLKDLFDRYSMDRERKIHESVWSVPNSSEEDFPTGAEPEKSGNQDDELGANVELF